MIDTERPQIVNKTLDYGVDREGNFYRVIMKAVEEPNGCGFSWSRVYDQSVNPEDVPELDLKSLRRLTVDIRRTPEGTRTVEALDYERNPFAVYRNTPNGLVEVVAPHRGPWKDIQPPQQVHLAIPGLLAGKDLKTVLSQYPNVVQARGFDQSHEDRVRSDFARNCAGFFTGNIRM